MGTRIDGKAIAQNINRETAKRVATLSKHKKTPKLAVLLVGHHKPSETYVRKKGEAAAEVGMAFALHRLPARSSTATVIAALQRIQRDPALSGLIVQLPLPRGIDTSRILETIRPEIDVDCLTMTNLGKLMTGAAEILPPTPGAVMSILEHLRVSPAGKRVTIVGTGMLVGKPLAIMMMNADATVTTCNSKTPNLKEACRAADILVTGVGKKHLITGNMVKRGAIVIDAGVSFEDARMFGDVDVRAALTRARYVTPTPGGVGPLTVARLLQNTVQCAEKKQRTV